MPMGLQSNEDGCCNGGVWAEEKVVKGRLEGWWCLSECSGNKNGVVVGKWLRMLKKKENEILRKDIKIRLCWSTYWSVHWSERWRR